MRTLFILLSLSAFLAGCVAAPHNGRHGSNPRGDRDHDGIPNRADRDRDGDGVSNRYDARPNDPRRN